MTRALDGIPRSLTILAACTLAMFTNGSAQEAKPSASGSSIYEPRLSELRIASVYWENHLGPDRRVVDQVCLVSDLPSFLEAVASWDEGRFFPVLFDDAELSLKFIRAFKPSKVVRLPKKPGPVAADRLWAAAVAAVGKSWARAEKEKDSPPGDAAPKSLGPTPCGLVFSEPGSTSLAGAVALAAGRFQPLVLWQPTMKKINDTLTEAEAEAMAGDLQKIVADRVAHYDTLGDDCDFLTLCGDWPFRYNAEKEPQKGLDCFDDLIGRDVRSQKRWAYAGRLLGGQTASAYAAMCSLFLQPRSALLFNGYPEQGIPWSGYQMKTGAQRLAKELRVGTMPMGKRPANVAAWHQVFDPVNPFGLVLVNSKGGPEEFHLQEGPASAADVPPSCPTAVLVIHSFSAATPTNPSTVAGRWLANGAFLYFGSMAEPYLDAFRKPTLVADLIADHLPISTAVKMLPSENNIFGGPWRLYVLGDPLYRLKPSSENRPRSVWNDIAAWPIYESSPPPASNAADLAKLTWCVKTALLQAASSTPKEREPAAAKGADLPSVLVAIRRDALASDAQPILDGLLNDVLTQAGRPTELIAALAKIPPRQRSTDVKRWLETVRVSEIHRALAGRRFDRAAAVWEELIRSDSSEIIKRYVSNRMTRAAVSPADVGLWNQKLSAALRDLGTTPNAPLIEEQQKDLAPRLNAARAKGARGGR